MLAQEGCEMRKLCGCWRRQVRRGVDIADVCVDGELSACDRRPVPSGRTAPRGHEATATLGRSPHVGAMVNPEDEPPSSSTETAESWIRRRPLVVRPQP